MTIYLTSIATSIATSKQVENDNHYPKTQTNFKLILFNPFTVFRR